jgi:hypothetical protein
MLTPIRFEQVSAAIGQDDRAIIRAEGRSARETFSFEMAQALAGLVAAVVQVALRDDAEGTDRREHPALGAVDLIHTVTITNRPTLTIAWQIEIPGEGISRLAFLVAVAFTRTAAAAKAPLP